MKLHNKNIVYLVGPEFEDLEFWVPLMRLREEGANVVVAGPNAGETFRGKGGLAAQADSAFEDVETKNFHGIVIPGGWAPDKLRRYDSVKRLVREMYENQKIVGMICHAGLVGISAGIVRGHTATGSEGIKDDLINAGATWLDKPAFRSGNIVWGRVVPDIPDFCRELVAAFTDDEVSQ